MPALICCRHGENLSLSTYAWVTIGPAWQLLAHLLWKEEAHVRASKFVLITRERAAALLSAAAEATPLVVANASFESPALADGTAISSSSVTFASQGGYGWIYDANSSIINPNASEFSNAAGNGTPLGADGPQVTDVTRVSGFGGIIQVLAGGDGIVGNGDDPVVTASTLYLLTVSVGHSLTRPNFGGYDIQLFAQMEPKTRSLLKLLTRRRHCARNLFRRRLISGQFDLVAICLRPSTGHSAATAVIQRYGSVRQCPPCDRARARELEPAVCWRAGAVYAASNAYAKMLRPR